MAYRRGERFQELRVLATSTDYQDRQKAVADLARSADDPVARALLLELVLDAEDTAVTLEASTTLTRRGDRAGLGILAAALVTADEQQTNWIETGIGDALGWSDEARDKAIEIVTECAPAAPDDAARRGIERLLLLLRTAGLR